MFKPDKPIEATKDDELGRADFSRSFGQAILAYNEKESIVTALYGDWGSGKSSVINMGLEFIEEQTKNHKKDERSIIAKFNPWNYSDQSHLIALFFKELSYALRREDYGEEAKKVGEKLEAYSNFFTPLALIPDPTVNMLSLLTQKVFSGVGKAAKAWGAAYSKDLESTRDELNKLLGKQKRKIIIVIDDIDRLNNDEIRQIFQLVKMLGDFPNTIYVLAFDRSVVVKALAKVQEGPGDDYLEKIVQFPVELPPISRSDLQKLLFTLLNELIKNIPKEKWDATYWGNIYHSGMKHYFKTMREVTRYINTLKFSFQMVHDDVNPVDFIAITTLQVFEPDLYSGIRDNKDIFTGVLGDAEKKQAIARCDEILQRAKLLEKEELTEFLIRLFPKLNSIYGNMGYGHDWMETWRRESRICHPDIFDIYFKLALPPGEVPKNEITSVLDLANDKEAFAQALTRLRDDERIIRYLELMEDYTKEHIRAEDIQNIVSVLMDIGDSFPEGKTGMFDFDTPMRILRIFRQLSTRFESQEERFNILRKAMIDATKSIYTIDHEVSVLGQEHGKFTEKEQLKPEEERTVSTEQLEELESIAVAKIEEWASSGKLDTHPHLASILYSWKRWALDGENKVKAYVRELVKSDEGLLSFISGFAGKSTSQAMGDRVARIHWRINLKNIEDFISVKEIEPRIRNLMDSSNFHELEDLKQKAISAFLDAFDGKEGD